MIVSINQPAYLPWLGYFHRIGSSDLHIVLDHVQFEKNSFTNRNKVRTNQGWCWLTVPLKTKGRFGSLNINHLEISNETSWARKHWDTIRFNYANAPFFHEHEQFFLDIYGQQWDRLIDLIGAMNSYLLRALGINTPLLFSSAMEVEGRKDELVVNLCRAVEASDYLSGPFGTRYLNEHAFESSGINVTYQEYCHPTYPQVYPHFEPYMSAIDLLFNCGQKSVEILMAGNISKLPESSLVQV